MESRCTECGTNTLMHHYIDTLCYNCYENLFKEEPKNSYEPRDKAKLDPLADEEPDFELKSEVADIQSAITNGTLVYTGVNYHKIKIPKQMVFDPDCRVKDYDKLVLFLLENMYIYEDAKGFDKVRYMFKEVDK